MSAEIVNLRRARKAAARSAGESAAAENRIRHGRSKAERAAVVQESGRATRALDGARLEGRDASPPMPRDGG